jgi:predicted Kef-type K+ transport protein
VESILLAIDPRDPLWIGIAFMCGLAVRLIGLPPLVGFLVAGFLLNIVGAEGGEFLRITADLGVTLLLFSIGLKLRLQSLARPEVWGVAVIHMSVMTALLAGFVLLLAATGLPLFSNVDGTMALLIGFVLSFSSTVFAVKILDALGMSASRHGRLAIGVLIIQDIAAVAFLAASTGNLPSIWALALVLLIPMRHLLKFLLVRTGHGELLILYGIVLAIGGADLFELVGMKGDLGALVIGMLLADHHKANELSKELMGFKDLFLLGFFLSVGMTAPPGWAELLAAALLIAFVPLKAAFYFGLFSAFRLRARTAWQASLDLANYSEFGLIVGTVAAAIGWLPNEWLAVFAVTLSLSFIGAAPVATSGDYLYSRWRTRLKRFERTERLPDDRDLDVTGIDVVIFGLGRVGTAVYDAVVHDYPGRVLGVDVDQQRIDRHRDNGRRVVVGDGTNPDFWSRAHGLAQQLEWVILTMPSHQANISAAEQLRELGYTGHIAATTKYPDEAAELQKLGVEFAFNIYAEAGTGFAGDLRRRFSSA